MTWACTKIKKSNTSLSQGFTIVELLIVVVVIAILAAITLVAYNNIQGRATFSREQSDLKTLTKAIALYKADNDAYPSTINQSGCTYNWCGWDQATGNNFINGLVPKYITKTPQMPSSLPNADTYLYQSNGTEYQLLRYKSDGLPAAENDPTTNPLYATGQGYDGLAWGYKSNPSMPWW